MAHAGGVIGAFEENQITGLCIGFGDVLALVPQTVGGSAPYIVAVLVVHPADIAAAIKTGFRGRAAPDVGRTHILLRLLVDGGKFAVRQGFCRNLIINTGCAGAIGATGRQSAVEQIRSAAQGVLKDLVAFPLVVVQFLPDDHLQATVHQLGVENLVLIRHLGRNRDTCRTDDPDRLIPNLHLHPCGQLVLLFEGLLQLALHFRPGVIIIQSGQE